MFLTPRTGQWALEAHGLQALRNVFISPLPHPGERWRGRGTLQLPTLPLAFQAPCTGHFAMMRRKNRALPTAMRWSSATKVILYLRKGEGYEKNFPLQGFTFGGKMPGLAGSYQGGLSQKPLCSPPPVPDNGTERNYLFSKRLSGRPSQAGLFPCGLEWGVGWGGGLLSSPRSWWASWRRQQQRAQELTAQLGAGAGRPLLPLVTDKEAAAAPPPRQRQWALSGSLAGPPCPGKGMTSEQGGLGHPGGHQGLSLQGELGNQCSARLPAWPTCLPGPRLPAWPSPSLAPETPRFSLHSVQDCAPPSVRLPAPTHPALLRKPLLRKLPGQGLPEAGLLGLQGSWGHVCFWEWR